MESQLARKFAIFGLAIGVTVILLWWFDMTFNPFHLPTWQQAPANYAEPLARKAIMRICFVLCPGLFLQMFTIGIGGWFSWLMWTVAALLNASIYYGIGLVVSASMRRER